MEGWQTVLVMVAGVAIGGLVTWVVEQMQARQLLEKLRLLVAAKRRVSLEEEYFMTEVLAGKIRRTPDLIVAVCPGGAMVAEWLSRRFLGNAREPVAVELVWADTVRSKGSTAAQRVTVSGGLRLEALQGRTGCEVLVVNDISRGGETLRAARQYVEPRLGGHNITTATLLCHVHANEKPDVCAAMTDQAVEFDWKEELGVVARVPALPLVGG